MDTALIRLLCFTGILTFFIGCGPEGTAEKYSDVKLGTNLIKVIPYSDETSVSDYIEEGYEVFEYKCGGTTVIVKDHKIRVNGKLYGVFKDGWTATIKNGEVRVNGEFRFQDVVY